LAQIYRTDIPEISFSLVTASIGGIAGAALAGTLLTRFHKLKYFLMFEFTAGISLTTMILPRLGHLAAYFAVMILNGAHVGAVHTGINALCLDTWRDPDGRKRPGGGPAIHSMHASFSIGALLAPLISFPFLSEKRKFSIKEAAKARAFNVSQTNNLTESGSNPYADYTESSIDVLYSIVGTVSLAVSLGYLYLGIKKVLAERNRRRTWRQEGHVPAKPQPPAVTYDKTDKLIMVMVALSVMGYIGGEFGIINFLVTFATNCDLHLTKVSLRNQFTSESPKTS